MDLNSGAGLGQWPSRYSSTRHLLDDQGAILAPRTAVGTVSISVKTDESGEEYTDVTLSVMGPKENGDFAALGAFMMIHGKELAENSEELESARSEEQFRRIAESLESPEESLDDDADNRELEVGWGLMSDLDRALALDYILRLREVVGEGSEGAVQGLDLTYVDHPVLRELETDQTHLHAVYLDEMYRVRDLLRDDEIEGYARVLEEHHRGEV